MAVEHIKFNYAIRKKTELRDDISELIKINGGHLDRQSD